MIQKNEEAQGLMTSIGSLALILIVIGTIVWLLGTYRIETNQGAILTTAGGEKIPITKVGWDSRLPLLTHVEMYSLANQNVYFPADYLQLEEKFKGDTQTGAIGFDIKTVNNKVVDVGVKMTYRIVDLYQWGVMNQNPHEMFQKKFDAITFNYLQTQADDKIINNMDKTNIELCTAIKSSSIEKDFGVRVDCPELLRATYTKIGIDALSNKQAAIELSEGELIAAKNKAEATKTLADATKYQMDILKGATPEYLQYSANIENAKVNMVLAQRKDNTIYVPYNSALVLNK